MKKYLFVVSLVMTFVGIAQTQKEYEVKYAIETFFEGFHQSDTLKMKSVLHPNMRLQSIQANKEGTDVLVTENLNRFLSVVAQYAKVQNWEEELMSFSFQIDGKLAQAWVPYQFYLNGMLSHCGANSFQLMKVDEHWKIVSILDTRRKDCIE